MIVGIQLLKKFEFAGFAIPGLFSTFGFLHNMGSCDLSRLESIDANGLLEFDPFLVLQKRLLNISRFGRFLHKLHGKKKKYENDRMC